MKSNCGMTFWRSPLLIRAESQFYMAKGLAASASPDWAHAASAPPALAPTVEPVAIGPAASTPPACAHVTSVSLAWARYSWPPTASALPVRVRASTQLAIGEGHVVLSLGFIHCVKKHKYSVVLVWFDFDEHNFFPSRFIYVEIDGI